MTRKEYIHEIRPMLRLAVALALYLRWGNGQYPDKGPDPLQCFPVADVFISEAEKQIEFD